MTENNQVIATLHNLLSDDAQKFTSAEILLKKVIPEWILKASSFQLKNILQKYLAYVEEHIKKMEIFYEDEQINSLSLSNRIMQAFIDEAEEKLEKCKEAPIRDACLLASVQAINHYKISTYGTAAAFANILGMEKEAEAFHLAEVNEKQIDDRLSQLAAHEINIKAKAPIEIGD